MSHFSLILLQQRGGLWSGFVSVKAASTSLWIVISNRGNGGTREGGTETCLQPLPPARLSLHVRSLPCLYPSNTIAKPGGCEQAHDDMTNTTMNITFLNGSWCVPLGLESNSKQGNSCKIQCRLTSYHYPGQELTLSSWSPVFTSLLLQLDTAVPRLKASLLAVELLG